MCKQDIMSPLGIQFGIDLTYSSPSPARISIAFSTTMINDKTRHDEPRVHCQIGQESSLNTL